MYRLDDIYYHPQVREASKGFRCEHDVACGCRDSLIDLITTFFEEQHEDSNVELRAMLEDDGFTDKEIDELIDKNELEFDDYDIETISQCMKIIIDGRKKGVSEEIDAAEIIKKLRGINQ